MPHIATITPRIPYTSALRAGHSSPLRYRMIAAPFIPHPGAVQSHANPARPASGPKHPCANQKNLLYRDCYSNPACHALLTRTLAAEERPSPALQVLSPFLFLVSRLPRARRPAVAPVPPRADEFRTTSGPRLAQARFVAHFCLSFRSGRARAASCSVYFLRVRIPDTADFFAFFPLLSLLRVGRTSCDVRLQA